MFNRVDRWLMASLPLCAACGQGRFNVPDGGCTETFGVLVSDLGGVSTSDAGCAAICGASGVNLDGGLRSCSFGTNSGTPDPVVFCSFPSECHNVGGRRPAGFDGVALYARDEVAEWLARTAALEAASVPAFTILAAELRAHGAPNALIEAALVSAEDERRHARAMARLARRAGAIAAPVELAPRPLRPLEELALENAVEGTVRERFGAALAAFQARAAADPETRAAFATIAPEEARHSALAGAVHEWSASRLGPAAIRRVDEARRIALASFARSLDGEPTPALRRAVGLPDATRAQDLLAALAS